MKTNLPFLLLYPDRNHQILWVGTSHQVPGKLSLDLSLHKFSWSLFPRQCCQWTQVFGYQD